MARGAGQDCCLRHEWADDSSLVLVCQLDLGRTVAEEAEATLLYWDAV